VWNNARRTYDLPESPAMAIEWYDGIPTGAIIEDQTEWRQVIAGLPNPIQAAVFVLLLVTGFRKSEALTLEGKNIHEDCAHLPIMKHFLRMRDRNPCRLMAPRENRIAIGRLLYRRTEA